MTKVLEEKEKQIQEVVLEKDLDGFVTCHKCGEVIHDEHDYCMVDVFESLIDSGEIELEKPYLEFVDFITPSPNQNNLLIRKNESWKYGETSTSMTIMYNRKVNRKGGIVEYYQDKDKVAELDSEKCVVYGGAQFMRRGRR